MSIGTGLIVGAAALFAQGLVGSEKATLLQLSLAIPKSGAAEHRRVMAEETAKITSCAEGMKLVERLKARGLHGSLSFNVKTSVSIAAIPGPLRNFLMTQPAGRATPVFGGDEAFRVLIRCEPAFIVPVPSSKDRPSSPAT